MRIPTTDHRSAEVAHTKNLNHKEVQKNPSKIDLAQESVLDAKTELSAKSKDFARAKAIASDVADVREKKVQDLSKKIVDGSYEVNSELIADRLVDDHLASLSGEHS